MSLMFPSMSIGFMPHADFKKGPCPPVDFKGYDPQQTVTIYILYRFDGSCTMGAAIVPQLSPLEGQAKP